MWPKSCAGKYPHGVVRRLILHTVQSRRRNVAATERQGLPWVTPQSDMCDMLADCFGLACEVGDRRRQVMSAAERTRDC